MISQAVYELLAFETLKIGHTRAHTHTSGRQLKIKFLDVLDYSESSDTNISNFFFTKTAASVRKQKWKIHKKIKCIDKNSKIHLIRTRNISSVYLLDNLFFQFFSSFSALILYKINVLNIFNMVDFFYFLFYREIFQSSHRISLLAIQKNRNSRNPYYFYAAHISVSRTQGVNRLDIRLFWLTCTYTRTQTVVLKL